MHMLTTTEQLHTPHRAIASNSNEDAQLFLVEFFVSFSFVRHLTNIQTMELIDRAFLLTLTTPFATLHFAFDLNFHVGFQFLIYLHEINTIHQILYLKSDFN